MKNIFNNCSRIKLTIVITLFSIMLTACGGGDSNQNVESNLTGTWKHTQIHKYYDAETDEYLGSNFIDVSLIFKEELGEIKYYACWGDGTNGAPVSKTDTQIITDDGSFFSRIFTKNIDGSYSTQEVKNLQDGGDDTTYYNQSFVLSKISNEIIIDKGLLVLNGPVSVAEYNHACVVRHYSNINDGAIYEIVIPYDDSTITLSLLTQSNPVVGPVNYTLASSSDSPIRLNISSQSTGFWNTVGSNTLTLETTSINIIESTDSILSGTYSFTTNDNLNYDGEFLMELQ